MSESFDKAVEAASLAMMGRPTLSATTIRAALRAALPHLTAQDVQRVLREAWDEGWRAGAGWPQDERNPYAEEADHE